MTPMTVNGVSFILSNNLSDSSLLINGGDNAVNPPENAVLYYRDISKKFGFTLCSTQTIYCTVSTQNINNQSDGTGYPYLYILPVI